MQLRAMAGALEELPEEGQRVAKEYKPLSLLNVEHVEDYLVDNIQPALADSSRLGILLSKLRQMRNNRISGRRGWKSWLLPMRDL